MSSPSQLHHQQNGGIRTDDTDKHNDIDIDIDNELLVRVGDDIIPITQISEDDKQRMTKTEYEVFSFFLFFFYLSLPVF